MLHGNFGVVLTNRELSDGFAMLTFPLAHGSWSCLDFARVQEDALSFGISLEVPLSEEPDCTS